MTTATVTPVALNFHDFYSLLELAQAIEAGYGARYDDRANYGDILAFKQGDYYVVQYGDDPEEARSWSKLEYHYDRLSYRVEFCAWQLVSREEVERLKAKAAGEGVAR